MKLHKRIENIVKQFNENTKAKKITEDIIKNNLIPGVNQQKKKPDPLNGPGTNWLDPRPIGQSWGWTTRGGLMAQPIEICIFFTNF